VVDSLSSGCHIDLAHSSHSLGCLRTSQRHASSTLVTTAILGSELVILHPSSLPCYILKWIYLPLAILSLIQLFATCLNCFHQCRVSERWDQLGATSPPHPGCSAASLLPAPTGFGPSSPLPQSAQVCSDASPSTRSLLSDLHRPAP
jgi:hypothetical protein